MASTITITDTTPPVFSSRSRFGAVHRTVIAWVSDASAGTVSNPLLLGGAVILQAEFAPGTPAPTDQYDLTLVDANGLDVLNGVGANLSATVPKISTINPYALVSGQLTLTIANAGNSKQGTVILWVGQS